MQLKRDTESDWVLREAQFGGKGCAGEDYIERCAQNSELQAVLLLLPQSHSPFCRSFRKLLSQSRNPTLCPRNQAPATFRCLSPKLGWPRQPPEGGREGGRERRVVFAKRSALGISFSNQEPKHTAKYFSCESYGSDYGAETFQKETPALVLSVPL